MTTKMLTKPIVQPAVIIDIQLNDDQRFFDVIYTFQFFCICKCDMNLTNKYSGGIRFIKKKIRPIKKIMERCKSEAFGFNGQVWRVIKMDGKKQGSAFLSLGKRGTVDQYMRT